MDALLLHVDPFYDEELYDIAYYHRVAEEIEAAVLLIRR